MFGRISAKRQVYSEDKRTVLSECCHPLKDSLTGNMEDLSKCPQKVRERVAGEMAFLCSVSIYYDAKLTLASR